MRSLHSEYGALLLIALRALLVVLRGCDPLLYQYVDGGGFFTSHGQPSKQMRLVGYIYYQRYRDHHDEEFIRRCERLRRQFILTSALCGYRRQHDCIDDLALSMRGSVS